MPVAGGVVELVRSAVDTAADARELVGETDGWGMAVANPGVEDSVLKVPGVA